MNAPAKILIKSDQNELEFIEEKKGIYRYKYVRSETKLNKVLELDEVQLQKLIDNNQ